MITERLLQFIWQFQYFNKSQLCVTTGEPLEILFPGFCNTNQGPDFNDARIRIGETVWAGTVELHILASGWDRHGHQHDRNYRNVILHVVWEEDAPYNHIPVLCLNGRIAGILLDKYKNMMDVQRSLPCRHGIKTVAGPVLENWKERMLIERLYRKSSQVRQHLVQNHYHWEETTWWLLARNFGIKVNADAFAEMARSIPFSVLNHCRPDLSRLEALLFGQANLLMETVTDNYAMMLGSEYGFLRRKNGLEPIRSPVHFLRMRPGNFPTIRLSQLASLLNKTAHLSDLIRETATVRDIRECFSVSASEYWNTHYRFGELSAYKEKKLGGSFLDSLLINTIVPLLFTYAEVRQEEKYRMRAIDWLLELNAEKNTVTGLFNEAGLANRSAFDSQAFLELHGSYCTHRRCLDCAIGNSILKRQ